MKTKFSFKFKIGTCLKISLEYGNIHKHFTGFQQISDADANWKTIEAVNFTDTAA